MVSALTVVVIKARQPFTLRRGYSQNADWRETALLRHVRVAITTAPAPGYVLPTGYFGWCPEPDKRNRRTTGNRSADGGGFRIPSHASGATERFPLWLIRDDGPAPEGERPSRSA